MFKGKDLTEEEIDKIFSEIDDNDSGSIQYTEFCMMAMKKSRQSLEDKIETAFKLIDKDGTGTISK